MKTAHLFSSTRLVFFAIILLSSCSETFNSYYQKSTYSFQYRDQVEKIDELLALYVNEEGFNGSILVAHEGEVIYKKGFGWANWEWEIPNDVATKFRIASVTKPFTAMLVMQLVAQNKLDLHEPISAYLPDYPKENGDKITVHHLLTHTSGITRDADIEHKLFHNPRELVDLFAHEPLTFSPGERFEYSNSGYILLGYLIETITGKPYKQVLEEQIFKPLGMEHSGYYRHRLLLKNRSSGYYKMNGDYFNANYRDFSNAYSAGALYSTVEDMFIWDQALYTESLLPKQYLDLMWTEHVADEAYGGHYGYGWELIKKPVGNSNVQIETISHGGSLPGYCAIFTRIPSSKTTIVLLNNTGRAFLNAITTAVTGILHDQAYDFPKQSVARALLGKIDQFGIQKGIAFYHQVKADNTYYLNEEELNILSYKLLASDRAEAAAEVLKLAIGSFPHAFNLYDSYGEVLLTLGNKEEAIVNYKKSVELNPGNKNGLRVLETLE